MSRLSSYSVIYRRGTAFILIVILLLVSYRVFFVQQITKDPAEIVWFETVQPQADSGEDKLPQQTTEVVKVNFITSAELQELGLKKTVADRWVKFRYSRTNFVSKEDIESVYGISKFWMDQFTWDFSPQVKARSKSNIVVQAPAKKNSPRLEDTLTKKVPPDTLRYRTHRQDKPKEIVVDINNSNEYQWQLLPGIGPYYAKRITNFRDKLGGFHSVQQVAATYGLPDSVFQSIAPMLKPSEISQKLLINTLTASEFAAHPYIRYKEASVLVNFRQNHGHYRSIQDLYEVKAFDSTFIERLQPYLDFSPSQERALANDEQGGQ